MYQQIILFMISASTALATVVSTLLCLFICVDGGHRLRLDRIQVKKEKIGTWREWIRGLWDGCAGCACCCGKEEVAGEDEGLDADDAPGTRRIAAAGHDERTDGREEEARQPLLQNGR